MKRRPLLVAEKRRRFLLAAAALAGCSTPGLKLDVPYVSTPTEAVDEMLRDSLTGPHVLGRNELQVMTAGDGIVHSEFNASETEPSHSLQIWIDPRAEDLTPSYQQIAFAKEDKRGRLHLLAGPESADPTRTAVINQDARVYVTEVDPDDRVTHALGEGRHAWIQVVRGDIDVNGMPLQQGDGAAISDERTVVVSGNGEVLLFDLP